MSDKHRTETSHISTNRPLTTVEKMALDAVTIEHQAFMKKVEEILSGTKFNADCIIKLWIGKNDSDNQRPLDTGAG